MKKVNAPISLEEIEAGIQAVIDSVAGLLSSVDSLIEAGHYGPAHGLAIMASEELGKIAVLTAMAQKAKVQGAKWGAMWGRFRNHRHKSAAGLVNRFPDETRKSRSSILNMAVIQQSMSQPIESLRQWSFYVDFDGTAREWVSPLHFTKEMAETTASQVREAYSRLAGFHAVGIYSLRALQLSQELYGAFFQANPEPSGASTRQDLLSYQDRVIPVHEEYYRRLVEEGIVAPEFQAPDLSSLTD